MKRRITPLQVKGPLISTGMGRGIHTWLAIIFTIMGVSLSLVAQSFTIAALGFLLLAAAIGLLGEIPYMLITREVRARIYSGGNPEKINKFLVIHRNDSPKRFYFYVSIYLILGSLSFLAASGMFILLVTKHTA